MKFKFSILVALVSLSIGSSAFLFASPTIDAPSAEIQPDVNHDSESTWPSDHAFFLAHGSAEDSVQIQENLSECNSEEESRDHTFSLTSGECTQEIYGSISLNFSTQIVRSQTLKKLLFPFHSFL
jgi:hypothetical protein